MKKVPVRALFWTILIYLVVVAVLASILWPGYGLAALGILLLGLAIAFVLKKDWWEKVKPVRRARKKESSGKRAQKETVMVLEDCESGQIHPIKKSPFVIGRSTDCDLVIPSRAVSRKHCQIRFKKETNHYYIEDLESTYGTFVGPRQLPKKSQTLLKINDMITVSDRKFIFKRESA